MQSKQMHPDEYSTMASAESSHWWYRSLHHLVLYTIRKYYGDKEISIIDAGCGTGGLMLFLKSKGYNDVRGFDLAAAAVQICKDRRVDVFRGDVQHIADYYPKASADLIICNDVLYFFDEKGQRKISDSMATLLRDHGLLIVNIPSLSAFRGIHDMRVGIQQRFSRKNLWKVFDEGTYELETVFYWPFLLSLFIWVSRWRQRLKIADNRQVPVSSDVKKENTLLNTLLFQITTLENLLLPKKPFGSSLYIVMKKRKEI